MGEAMIESKAWIHNRVFEIKGQPTFTIREALTMQEISGKTFFAEAIAEVSGGTFVKLPSIEHDCDSILETWNHLYSQLGALSKRFNEAVRDNEIDGKEKADLTAIANEIHKTTQQLLALTFKVYCREA